MVGGLTRIITQELFVFVLFLVSAESVAKGTLALSLLPVSFLSVFLSVFSEHNALALPYTQYLRES